MWHGIRAVYAQFNNGAQVTNCTLTAAGSCTIFIPITPFNGFASADFFGFVDADVSANTFDVDGITSPVADYNDTAMVDSLLLVDTNGNPIQAANIVSASGTNYNGIAFATAPEPSSCSTADWLPCDGSYGPQRALGLKRAEL